MDDCDALIREVKAATATLGPVPVILLSANAGQAGQVEAGDLPANASAVRPFTIIELLARVRAALGQPQGVEREGVLVAGDVRMDFARRVITKNGREIHLSRREYDLLQCLASNPDHVLGQKQILKTVWGADHLNDKQYLRVYIQQLRQKLENDPAVPRLLVTELGIGYRLRTNP
jgi:two-component system KDP operon response regulator KdpE